MPLVTRRLLIGFAFIGMLIVAGVVGLTTVEHESLLDAILTTVSAISTVGYSPPRPLGAFGKILAIILIVGGLFALALVISALTEYFVEGHLQGVWNRRVTERAIEQLRDHFIVCGYGRVGREVAHRLAGDNLEFVVLDVNEVSIGDAKNEGYLAVVEDASHEDILLRLGIDRARGLMACSDSDANNVYITLTARAANARVFIVARAAQPDAERKLYMAGANRVVSPYVMAGRQIAELATQTAVADSFNLVFDGERLDVQVQEMAVEAGSPLVGRSIGDLHDTVLHGAFVLAIHRQDQLMQDVRSGVQIRAGDRLLVVGSGAQLAKLSTID